MDFTKPCDTCAHNKVCFYKEDLSRAIDTIRDEVRRKTPVLTINISCAEYRENLTVRRI